MSVLINMLVLIIHAKIHVIFHMDLVDLKLCVKFLHTGLFVYAHQDGLETLIRNAIHVG